MTRLFAATALAGLLAACGPAPENPSADGPPPVPAIGTGMEMPVDDPFCVFAADSETGPLTGDDARFVFVTEIGESVYHGYIMLDGAVTKLTEVEAGFGAGMETRRYVNANESMEFELILLDENVDAAVARYTGSVRVIFPVEGDAVKFHGVCAVSGGSDE